MSYQQQASDPTVNRGKFVIIGTAGHIDHGKTALVYALTGKNTDRLKEEQARGISIDIDFAPLRFEDGVLCGVIDVPGHERFIRNMLAGAAGIDAALLTVDVNEGIKPQTEEHLAILQVLGVQKLIVALTKCDLADGEWVTMVEEVVREWLSAGPYKDAPVIATSAVSGQGLDTLRQVLHEVALQATDKDPGGAFRLPVDKVFSIPGFGTVVSGTVWRGTVSVGQHLEVLPGRREVRVRGIQSHGKPVEAVQAGQRAALNLASVSHEEVHRGHIVAAPGTLTECRLLDAHLDALALHERGIAHRERVHVHLGTAQAVGRVLLLQDDELPAGESGYAQLVLDTPLVVEAGDHFVLRSYSPVVTIGGGHVVNPEPARLHRRKRAHLIAELEARDRESPLERVIRRTQRTPISLAAIAADLGYRENEARALLDSGKSAGRLVELPSGWMSAEAVEGLLQVCVEALRALHHKYRFRSWLAERDITAPELRPLSARDLGWIYQEGARTQRFDLRSGFIRVHGWEVHLSDEEKLIYDRMLEVLAQSDLEGRTRAELTSLFPNRDRVADALLHFALEQGEAVQLADGALLRSPMFEDVVGQIQTLYQEEGEFTVAQVRDLLGSTRKPTLNLLETLDKKGLTVRQGDVRKYVD